MYKRWLLVIELEMCVQRSSARLGWSRGGGRFLRPVRLVVRTPFTPSTLGLSLAKLLLLVSASIDMDSERALRTDPNPAFLPWTRLHSWSASANGTAGHPARWLPMPLD